MNYGSNLTLLEMDTRSNVRSMQSQVEKQRRQRSANRNNVEKNSVGGGKPSGFSNLELGMSAIASVIVATGIIGLVHTV